MAFCGKCGAKNNDGARYCVKCGAPLKNVSEITKGQTSSEIQVTDRNKKIGMLAVALAAVAVVIFAVFLFGGRSYKSTIKQYVENQFDGNAKALFKLIPDDMVDYMLEEDGYDEDDLDDLIEEIEEDLNDQIESLDNYLGDKWKISYEILAVEDMKGDDLDDIKDDYEDANIKVSAAKIVEIEILITADETESSDTLDIALIKSGRSWYLDIMSMGGLY